MEVKDYCYSKITHSHEEVEDDDDDDDDELKGCR
jgi:hypothetical protein